jgi:hypothetical protein
MDLAMKDHLMTPDHPLWDEFMKRISGEEGINTRLQGNLLKWSCDHSERMVFTRYVLAEYEGVDVDASVAWFRGRGWCCDCEVLFCSDSSPEERRAWYRRRASR